MEQKFCIYAYQIDKATQKISLNNTTEIITSYKRKLLSDEFKFSGGKNYLKEDNSLLYLYEYLNGSQIQTEFIDLQNYVGRIMKDPNHNDLFFGEIDYKKSQDANLDLPEKLRIHLHIPERDRDMLYLMMFEICEEITKKKVFEYLEKSRTGISNLSNKILLKATNFEKNNN